MNRVRKNEFQRKVAAHAAIFSALEDSVIDEALAHANERFFLRGARIFAESEDANLVFVVISGYVRLSSAGQDGREITLAIVGPGEMFGELGALDGEPRSATATACEDTLVLSIERQQFLTLVREHAPTAMEVALLLSRRLRRMDLALEEMAFLDLPTRLGRVLVNLARASGRLTPRGVKLGIRLSQKDLASLVAASRENVSRQLKEWREAGLLASDGGYFLLPKPEALSVPIKDRNEINQTK